MNEHTRAVGVIAVHPRGFGFLDLETPTGEGTTSAFVPPPALNRFLAGDRVEARLVPQEGGRLMADDLVLRERRATALVGDVVSRRGKLFLKLDPTQANTDWPLLITGKAPEAGECWVAEVEGDQLKAVRPVAEAERGLERVLVQFDLHERYPEFKVPPLDRSDRRDLRGVPTVTIDAPSSRDLDDAISAFPADAEGYVRVLVSIADVDAAVPEGSPLDLDARRRSTSVYLPGRVIPMLPRALSEDALSLLPGVERGAMTVELRIDPEGEVVATDIYPSLIASDARLDYERVAAFLDGGEGEDLPEVALEPLRWARTAAARIGASRSTRGGVRLLREEVKFVLDADGEPVEAEARHTNSAHLLIERLMVAANEAVATWMHARGLPAVYRVHPAPEAAAVRALVRSAQLAGFEPGLGKGLSPRALAAFEQQFADTPQAPAMYAVLAQALGPARYTVHPSSHFGLGAPLYLHFTSPIRR
ncbi:MAG: VacB/RNase II family 3'-5' exoribonuclease, partial [Myxococcales bacterium]|nr:VacB/RNase II family 3'-5' exoribonuclease [Myxococcales bacterium]